MPIQLKPTILRYKNDQGQFQEADCLKGQDVTFEQMEEVVTGWLDENFTNPDSPPLDRSLSIANAAAPADMVGDLRSAIDKEVYDTNSIDSSGWTWERGTITSTGSPSNSNYVIRTAYIETSTFGEASNRKLRYIGSKANSNDKSYFAYVYYYSTSQYSSFISRTLLLSDVTGNTTDSEIPSGANYVRFTFGHTTASGVQTQTSEASAFSVSKIFPISSKLITIKDYITPEMYGAKADGVQDDTQAILDAFNACKTDGKYLVCPGKRYKTTQNCILNFGSSEFNVYVYGTVDYIEFVGDPIKMSAIEIVVRKATTVTFKDFKGLSAFVENTTTLNVNASTTSGSAYNNFRGGFANNLNVEGLVSGAWVNENKFYSFRVVNLSIIGMEYPNNNNRFYDTVVEGGTITLNYANSNYIQIRGEGGYTSNFSNQRNNIIERTFVDALANISEPVYYGAFSFSSYSQIKYMSMLEILRFDRTNMELYDERNIYIPAWTTIATIYIRTGSMMSLAVNPSDTFRYSFRLLNSQFENITTDNVNTTGAISPGATYKSGDNPRWDVSVNVPFANIKIYDDDNTHWLQVTFTTGDSSFIAPCFSVFLRTLTAPEYFLGYSLLD